MCFWLEKISTTFESVLFLWESVGVLIINFPPCLNTLLVHLPFPFLLWPRGIASKCSPIKNEKSSGKAGKKKNLSLLLVSGFSIFRHSKPEKSFADKLKLASWTSQIYHNPKLPCWCVVICFFAVQLRYETINDSRHLKFEKQGSNILK
jgi:hypothetical protein